jgi:hypothetical protein
VTFEGEDLRLQGIQCLIVHYLSVMMYVKGDRTLLQPLQSLMMNPQACVVSCYYFIELSYHVHE